MIVKLNKSIAKLSLILFFLAFIIGFALIQNNSVVKSADELPKETVTYTPSIIREFYPANEIRIESQDYIDAYFEWQFTEINSTYCLVNFTINQTLWNDVKTCLAEKGPKRATCFANLCNKYFSGYLECSVQGAKLEADFSNITNYPLVNLTKSINFKSFQIDLDNGKGSFYIIFPSGFKEGERAKFGFGSTVINTGTTIPWYPNSRTICKDGTGKLHVVWVYNSTWLAYANSTDGATWLVNDFFSKGSSISAGSISCNGNNITVAYEFNSGTVTVGISTNNGGTWSFQNVTFSINSLVSKDVSIERRGQRIYMLYSNIRSFTPYNGLIFRNSTDGGSTWSAEKVLYSQTSYTSLAASSLAVNGTGGTTDILYVAFMNGTDRDVWVFNSTDSGVTWGTRKDAMVGTFNQPSITFSGNNLYVAAYNTSNRILYTNSSNSGANWQALTVLSNTSTTNNQSLYASVSIDNNNYPIVFWETNSTNANKDIVYRKWTGSAWSDDTYITNNNFGNTFVNTPYTYYSDNKVHYIWRNGTVSPYQIMYDYVSLAVADTTPPAYSLNSTNSTLAGTPIKHSLNWTDDVALSSYIFSFDNCTGTLTNDSAISFNSGTWSNVTKTINSTVGCTIRWCVYANDTSNKWNGTSCLNPFSYVTTSATNLAFTIKVVNASAVESSSSGTATSNIEANATASTQVNVNPCLVGGICQDGYALYNFTNIGTGINLKWEMQLNTTLPTCMKVFGSRVNSTTTTNSINSTTAWIVNSSISPGVSDYAWVFMNFTSCVDTDDKVLAILNNGTQI